MDWRLVVAVAVLVLVAAIANDLVAKGARVDALIGQLRDERSSSKASRAAAAAERDQLLANQLRLIRQLTRTNEQLRGLQRYVAEQLGLPGLTSPRANNETDAGGPLGPPRTTPGEQKTRPRAQSLPAPVGGPKPGAGAPTPAPAPAPAPAPKPPNPPGPLDGLGNLIGDLLP